MSTPHELRAYDYVNHPYAAVRDALRSQSSIFERATRGAASRADALVASLKIELAGVEIGARVDIEVGQVEDDPKGLDGRTPTTRMPLTWKAARAPGLFPSMEAVLSIYPLSATETQLDLHGKYTPPLGVLGSALDSMAGHRVAEASVRRFVTDVAELLRNELR